LVHACLNKLQYQQLKSNWTKFTFQEYLIGSLISLMVIIPVTILLLSTSLPIGLPYSLTTLISVITILHIVWGVFDIYDTTSNYNIYIRLFLGLIITSGLVIPLFFIPCAYHLVYSELSTIGYTLIILLASYTRGILGYKLYPVDNLYLQDLLPHTKTDQDQDQDHQLYSQPYYQQSESLFEIPISVQPLQRKKTVSNVNQMRQHEYYTNYYYQNGKIISSIFDDGRENILPPQFQSLPPLSSKYGYPPVSVNSPSQTTYSYHYQPSSRDIEEEDQYSIENIPARPTSTAIQNYGKNGKGGEDEENSIRFIQVMRVACIFFGLYYIILNILYGSLSYMSVSLILLIFFYYSDIFKSIEKLKGMLVFWSTLLVSLLSLLFLLNLPFFIHRKHFPSLIMRIDKSLADELPLLNRTTVSGFYVQNQVS